MKPISSIHLVILVVGFVQPALADLELSEEKQAVIDQVDSLEQELGMNVVTASQAIFWEALRRSGIEEPIPGFGRLFREF